MNDIADTSDYEFTAQYMAALRGHLTGGEEASLRRVHELGSQALAANLSLGTLVTIHHRALAGLLPDLMGPGLPTDAKARAEFFLNEALRPFQRLLDGHGESLARINQLSQRLAEANERLSDTNLEKDQAIAELRRANAELAQAQAAAAANLKAEASERRLTEIALRDSESRFRAIFEKAGIGIALVDKYGKIRESNLALRAMLGYSGEELHGRVIFGLSHPDDIQLSALRFQGLVAGEYSHYKLDKRFIRKDGTALWVRKIVSGVCGFRGELLFAIDMIEDITDSRLAEDALRESESRFRQVVDMTCEWIWEQDAEGRYLYSSGAVGHILGYEAEEIIGRKYRDLYFPEDGAVEAKIGPEAIGGQGPFHRLVNRYRHKDGREIFTESTGTPIAEADGQVLKWRGVDHDITERKRFEDALRLRDRAIEASSVGIIITDPHQPGNPIIYANPAFVEMTGRERDEVIGQNPRFLQGPETDPEAIECLRTALREGRDCHMTLKNYRKDGSPFWNELYISPVRDHQGRLTHFIGTQTDVTLLRRVEEERHEMEIARRIQLSLLPGKPLRVEGALVAGNCLPAVHVGGDYFDYFAREDTVDIVIADVSGHSVGAAMIMAETRSTLKMETHWARQGQTSLDKRAGQTLAVLNDLLFEDLDRAEFFISMFYLRFEPKTRRLAYANAGHNCPLLWRARDRDCEELDADGILLGVMRGARFEEKNLVIEAGDVLLLYTDGVTEARDESGEFFGVPRLRGLLTAHAEDSPEALVEAVMSGLRRFCGGRPFEDDISLVALKTL